MTLTNLVATLDELGVCLGVRLVVDAPHGVLTDEIRAALVEHRTLLLQRLVREAQWEVLRNERWGPAVGDPAPGIDNPGRLLNPRAFARAIAAADAVPPLAADSSTDPNPMDVLQDRAIMRGSGTGATVTAPAPLIRPLN